jgi:hypothetical protein
LNKKINLYIFYVLPFIFSLLPNNYLFAGTVNGSLNVGTVIPTICYIDENTKNDTNYFLLNVHCNTPHRLTIKNRGQDGHASLVYNEIKKIILPKSTKSWIVDEVVIDKFKLYLEPNTVPNNILISISPTY